jgi:hypothetical protein
MDKTLRKKGYLVHIWSVYAPADISKERVVERLSKPIHFQDEFVGKRYGSLAMMADLKNSANHLILSNDFTLFYNPNNTDVPKKAYNELQERYIDDVGRNDHCLPYSRFSDKEILLKILQDIDAETQADFYPNTPETNQQLDTFRNFIRHLAR